MPMTGNSRQTQTPSTHDRSVHTNKIYTSANSKWHLSTTRTVQQGKFLTHARLWLSIVHINAHNKQLPLSSRTFKLNQGLDLLLYKRTHTLLPSLGDKGTLTHSRSRAFSFGPYVCHQSQCVPGRPKCQGTVWPMANALFVCTGHWSTDIIQTLEDI